MPDAVRQATDKERVARIRKRKRDDAEQAGDAEQAVVDPPQSGLRMEGEQAEEEDEEVGQEAESLVPSMTLGRIRRSRAPAQTQAPTVAALERFRQFEAITAAAVYYRSRAAYDAGQRVDPWGMKFKTPDGDDVVHGTGLIATLVIQPDETVFCAVMPLFATKGRADVAASLELYEESMDQEGLSGSIVRIEGDPGVGDAGLPLIEVIESEGQKRLVPTLLYYVNRGVKNSSNTQGVKKSSNTIVRWQTRQTQSNGFEAVVELVAKRVIGPGHEILWDYYRGAAANKIADLDDADEEYMDNRRATQGKGYFVDVA